MEFYLREQLILDNDADFYTAHITELRTEDCTFMTALLTSEKLASFRRFSLGSESESGFMYR